MKVEQILVFTLQSIKSRIETQRTKRSKKRRIKFLLYSPLNQGLKLPRQKQLCGTKNKFLLYSPLNQGLKPRPALLPKEKEMVFTLQSIKSRIETP